MVDMLEEENPGCFDQDDKTFIDLYMKSGLYITEIVKRLYRSEEMKRKYPDPTKRLDHIFEKQVFGLAPTEIIYRIATSYILGFDDVYTLDTHNFRQVDALPYAKNGTLSQKLDELFGDKVKEQSEDSAVPTVETKAYKADAEAVKAVTETQKTTITEKETEKVEPVKITTAEAESVKGKEKEPEKTHAPEPYKAPEKRMSLRAFINSFRKN